MKGFTVNHIIFSIVVNLVYRLTVNKDIKIKLLNNEKFEIFFTDCMQFNENIFVFVISIND
jgi:uncharacterized membrane protein YagU involved in acid resistance